MELQEFVSGALVQIVAGIEQARKRIEELGGEIVVDNAGGKSPSGFETRGGYLIQEVGFDVAVVAGTTSENRSGIGVVASIIALGASQKDQLRNEVVSRVKFSVPLRFPCMGR